MSPDELIGRLEQLGISISRPTLARWTRKGLISTPRTGSYGRGKGRWTDYPPQALEEAACVYMVRQEKNLWHITDEMVLKAKERAARVYEPELEHSQGLHEPLSFLLYEETKGPVVRWVCTGEKVRRGFSLETPIRVEFVRQLRKPKETVLKDIQVEIAEADTVSVKYIRAEEPNHEMPK